MQFIDEQALDFFNESSFLVQDALEKHSLVPGVSVAIIKPTDTNTRVHRVSLIAKGLARVSTDEPLTAAHYLQCASLSKTVATAFAIEYFADKGLDMKATSVNALLRSIGAVWRIESAPKFAADDVTLSMLVNHTALGMHYVYGIPLQQYADHVTPIHLLNGSGLPASYGYKKLTLERQPGAKFSYSGGGFVVLQYLVEEMERRPIEEITREFLDGCGLKDFSFSQLLLDDSVTKVAYGHSTPDKEVDPQLAFPPFAAGALCSPGAMASFLLYLTAAFQNWPEEEYRSSISHRTARIMLGEESLLDLGAFDFMGAKIGLGVFVAEAGANRVMLHQAANDGYRGVYMLCFAGPDTGKGFIILSNGDNPAVLLQCELARLLLGPKVLNMEGIDFSVFERTAVDFDMSSVTQESIVNKGLKELVMNAFLPSSDHNHQKISSKL